MSRTILLTLCVALCLLTLLLFVFSLLRQPYNLPQTVLATLLLAFSVALTLVTLNERNEDFKF